MANSHLRRPAARSTAKPPVRGLICYNRWAPLAMLIQEEEEATRQHDRLSSLPDQVLLNIVKRLDNADAARTGILSTRWRHIPAMLAKIRTEEYDWLSSLPNDVLLNIVERLGFTDVARTSILSRRWKKIPTMLSEILLMVGSTDNMQERSSDDVARANATVLGATRSLLESRSSTSPHTIHRLCMQFFLGDGSAGICRASANTMATQNVGEAELTLLTEKEIKRCSHADMLVNGRQLISLIDDCPDAFGGITRLRLENLSLGESDFPRIFRLCRRLEFLRLDRCDMGFRSLLDVEHPRLREIDIFRSGFERVHLKWLPQLTTLTFSFWVSLHEPLSFGYVPLLHTVSVRNAARSWHKMLKLSQVLGKATVRNLHLGFEREKIWVKPEGPRELWQVFSKLRLVNLAAISKECDLTWTMFVLQGAPSLEELCIRVCDCMGIWDKDKRKRLAFTEERRDADAQWETSGFKHRNLSVLRIFGFQSEDKFVDYAKAVMEAAVNLKDIYLHEKPACKVHCAYRRRQSHRYPWSRVEKILVRSSLGIHKRPLLRLHFLF